MSDYMIRATAAGGAVRAFAAVTRDMVEEARRAHDTTPVCTAALGRLLTGGVMMGSMLKEDKALLTLQVHGDGPIGGITVTADSHFHAKGYVNNPHVQLPLNAKGKLDVGGAVGKGTLTVVRDLGLKEPYVGTVRLQSGELADDLTYYFAESEQVPGSVALGVLVDRDWSVKQAGGFIIQLLPGASDGVISALEERLSKIVSVTQMLAEGQTPEDILNTLLDGMEPEFLEKDPVSFYCGCSRERIERVLFSIGTKDLEEMIADGEPIEVGCSFCGKKYGFGPDDLRRILETRRKGKKR